MSDTAFPYQDASLAIAARVEDLLARMTLADKAGLMFQPPIQVADDLGTRVMGSLSNRDLLERRITHANVVATRSAREMAAWHNALQREASEIGLGIPFTISSDPRHAFTDNPATALMSGPFSQWPEFLGFGALDDPELTRRFGDVVRREYLAVGIRSALHPQIDLATEPRWSRGIGTFGQNVDVVGRLGLAYMLGLQGDALGPQSVAAMAKHFPGGGPQLDGEDPHFSYGREQVYPGGRFDLHLQPFRDLLDAGVSQIMPYYGMPVGTEYEEVGFAFNKQIINDLLREELGYDGVVCTDWGVLSSQFWGVESLTFDERLIKSLEAGVDQFGGETDVQALIDLVRGGRVSESRLDISVRRLLREKFSLGLFDEARYVDVDSADELVGSADARAAGLEAQSAAFTLLTNGEGAAHLPLSGQPSVYLEGGEPGDFAGWADVVSDPERADVAIVRLNAPWEQRGGVLDSFFHAGSLDFPAETISHLRALSEKAPLILDIYLDRPAILAPLLTFASTILVNFGACDEAFTRVVFGAAEPRGSLPVDIPESMDAVAGSRPDVPADTARPTFSYGHGLRYADWTPAERPAASTTSIERKTETARYDLTRAALATVVEDDEARDILDRMGFDLREHPAYPVVSLMPMEAVFEILAELVPSDMLQDVRLSLAALPPR
ncbi:glycoside hydrolase family 3 N-terminal domain-containing protein [Microbacterium sp. B35-30]|uniref:glycoside hydrolase family 3 protein n=1 Tax=Microbacterium sp. B35-30 TaxID=1962642 RepID=UPI001EF95B92|nr:glycoside hydrolase family 3 N-terminal domain-containing protein [Microbacterium sp. B35-30]KAF2417547.1 beta-glucosidase [Microbacterium sp. B35-30]